MILTVVLRELQQHVLSLRLHLVLVLLMVMFGLGTVSFIKMYKADQERYRQIHNAHLEKEREWAAKRLGLYMAQTRPMLLEPRASAFITDAGEKMMPFQFWFTGFGVESFDVPNWASNDMLPSFRELSWAFIVSIIISFTVLIFSYDIVSGDRETGTLALAASNPAPRGVLLFGKYLGVVLASVLVLLPGVILSLAILLAEKALVLDRILLAEIAAFLGNAALLASCMAALGLLASTVTSRSNVSLLLCLCLWLASVVVVPNSVVYITGKLNPIESSRVVADRIAQEVKASNDRIASAESQNGGVLTPIEQFRLYAKFNMQFKERELAIKDAWNSSLLEQFRFSRRLIALSPVCLFEQLCEAATGGGFVRLEKNWQDLKQFRSQLFEWYMALDAAATEDETLHIVDPYNPGRMLFKVVNFEQIPQFQERRASFSERLSSARLPLLLLILYTGAAFALSFVLFLRYDVR